MPSTFGIVDLFAGPGGLGEGFSAFQDQSGSYPFSIEVSIEKDSAAHATLRLRSFLRKFGDSPPAEYHEFLNGRQHEPPWSSLYPEQWEAAEYEACCMELGEESTNRFLRSRIADIRKKCGDRTVLIGGPPCQAYSLVGRSRNAGIADYLPHKDGRNFLYQKYVDVLCQLEPAAFVMENVTGMLSSAIKGDLIFQRVMADLRSAAGSDNYRLLALAPDDQGANGDKEPVPRDFVVRMEDHGIPQARHRVIIVGLRQDFANNLPDDLLPRLTRYELPITVDDVIGAMPRLRSGLSKHDTYGAWRDAVLDAAKILCHEAACIPEVFREGFAAVALEASEILRAGPVPETNIGLRYRRAKFLSCPAA